MQCTKCGHIERGNSWHCSECGVEIPGGVIFVTGISGSGIRIFLDRMVENAEKHGHTTMRHDIGHIMHKHAEVDRLNVQWEKILDAEPIAFGLLRALAFQEVAYQVNSNPRTLHIIDLHLSFRWKAHLTQGFAPHILEPFRSHARLFINVLEDLVKVQERLMEMSWGKREILELLVWRDEELFLADLYADICGLERSYAIAAAEPPSILENLIWHPDLNKVYLSFPITKLVEDPDAHKEVRDFRDSIREFLIVFDPWAIKDYDETYKRPEMKLLRPEIGDVTEERDYRFIDQADALVAYYPRNVSSKGVDAEMRYAHKTGKPIFLYKPDLGEELGPFVVPPSHSSDDPNVFLKLLRTKLGPSKRKRK
jgi:hypothetical protein